MAEGGGRLSLADFSVEGVVMDYSTRWIRVALPAESAGQVRGSPWRLDQYGNTTAHERYLPLLPPSSNYIQGLREGICLWCTDLPFFFGGHSWGRQSATHSCTRVRVPVSRRDRA